jgi:alkylation response protein AidB-like acyl-CoA dehydrogenase
LDLRYSETDEKFRAELRAWLDEAVPAHGAQPPISDWAARREYDTGWQRRLFDAGYAGINWPKAYGGRDASLTEQLVWCQGFSEPGAGSDLAALATRAVRDGDHYVVTGHKIWCSFAHVADYCELLVRTDPDAPKHRGISWLILPMDADGIEIRPLPTLAGEGEFGELFLDGVRIPVENLVGEENDGWRVTNVTLRFERGTAFASDMIHLQQFVRELIDAAKRVPRGGGSAWDDPALRREVGHASAELDALWAMVKLSVCRSSKTGVPGLEGSAIKLFYTELYQRICELGMRILGRAALSREDVAGLPSGHVLHRALQSLSLTIAAGTSQIQRNIIAERILGLPKERR